MEKYQTEYNRYAEEKTALFSIAGVKEEEAFLEKAALEKERDTYKERLSTIDVQLEIAHISKEQIPLYKKS